jgi:hypothetical protein
LSFSLFIPNAGLKLFQIYHIFPALFSIELSQKPSELSAKQLPANQL